MHRKLSAYQRNSEVKNTHPTGANAEALNLLVNVDLRDIHGILEAAFGGRLRGT